ncbi:hypothetical protein VTJ04DRAFT_3700 [Mycothermus thermophilus]|uniref:uncharacterized protein n=1 Tax=Humicola insolens TaxID=85995 RepID=UPI003743D612
MSFTTTAASSTYNTTTRHTLSRRPLRGGTTTASTPNLNQLYAAHQGAATHHQQPQLSPSRLAAPPPPPSLSRKGSVAALTQNSLAAIPDDSHAYAYNTVLNNNAAAAAAAAAADPMPPMPPPHTPGRLAGAADEVAIGDTVEVPGGMTGTVRFIGPVAGRKGTFAGVELHPEFAPRGKNSGDVDGVYYFTTVQPGAGIFLPLSKAIKREPPPIPNSASYPITPASAGGGLRVASHNAANYTPSTPGVPKLSQSVGPSTRAASPLGKKVRPSLQRPESPVRRLMTPGPRTTGIATPAPPQTGPTNPPRFGTPTSANKFGASIRSNAGGAAGDPSKRATPGPGPGPGGGGGGGGGHARKPSVGPRSASALGALGGGTGGPHHHNMGDDEVPGLGIQRTQTNGSLGSSVSSFALKVRPASRAMSRTGNHASAAEEEVERLRAELEERDRQLKEQAQTLAEMESSLNELQGLIENSEGPPAPPRRDSLGDKDTAQLRALVREKNDKIAQLTAEFDAHRADFRSTIDTLEMASAETERVYEKRIEELMLEIQELQERTADVDTIAAQLKQLEELVQELEEGLEDARRGEAEARGEVEFLRGEVERTRAELRREKEKAREALANATAANGGGGGGATAALVNDLRKELEQKEDEIRGLKAIIHSLSRDSVPGENSPEKTPTQRPSSFPHHESVEDRLVRDKLEREVAELRALLESKSAREEELERELEVMRRQSVVTAVGPNNRASGVTVGSHEQHQRSSIRDSRGTVTVTSPKAPSTASIPAVVAPAGGAGAGAGSRKNTLTQPQQQETVTGESDAYSTATENSSLWCEICEAAGHDILSCTNVFGTTTTSDQQKKPEATTTTAAAAGNGNEDGGAPLTSAAETPDFDALEVDALGIKPAPLSPMKPVTPTTMKHPAVLTPGGGGAALSTTATTTTGVANAPAPTLRPMPSFSDQGPVAGKTSGVVEADKWCALCERDGHGSVDCPFEDAF